MATFVNHSTLASLISLTVRVFLKLYDCYSSFLLKECVRFPSKDAPPVKVISQLPLKFYVDVELLKNVIQLGTTEGVDLFEEVNDEPLRDFFPKNTSQSNVSVPL